jgi:hypothetical protein
VSESGSVPEGEIVARAGRYYRNARYLLAAGIVIYGILSIKDGFFVYPRLNAEALARDPLNKLPYSDMDILFNRALGVALPPAGALLVLWALYKSRGEYRLNGQTLLVPGQGPIPLSGIESLDKSQWDRKGVAVVAYRRPDGTGGSFKLDDFVYEREAIDEIYKRIERSFQEPGGEG